MLLSVITAEAQTQRPVKTVPGVHLQKLAKPSHLSHTPPVSNEPTIIHFGKVYEYVNDESHTQRTADAAAQLEQRYFNFGAVTRQQKKQKKGHYFTFFWKPRRPLTEGKVVWEYLQEHEANTVFTQEQPFARAHGWQASRFAVVGDQYNPRNKCLEPDCKLGGRVIAWRLRIYENNTLVGETTSFVW